MRLSTYIHEGGIALHAYNVIYIALCVFSQLLLRVYKWSGDDGKEVNIRREGERNLRKIAVCSTRRT